MAIYAQVKVKNGQYKLKGDFHVVSPSLPIRNEDEGWRLMGVTNPRAVTHIHMYGGEAAFFEALGRGRLLGTRCDNVACETAGTVYLPFRIHCPDCLARNTVVDLTDLARRAAKVHTFMVCQRSGAFNTLDKPIKFINVEFEGVATILMSYLAVGQPRIGMRVRPIFKTVNPTHTITDLAFVAEDAPADQLPMDYTFGA